MKRLSWFVPVMLLPLVIMAAVALAAENAADLAKSLSSKKAADRSKAADGLANLGGQAKPAVPALVKALKDADAGVRGHAALALGQIGDQRQAVIDGLFALATDGDAAVRRAALRAIRSLRLPRAVVIPKMVEVLKSAQPAIALTALSTLAEAGKEAVPFLTDCLKDKEASYWACLALAQIGPPASAAVPGLVKLLARDEPEVRLQALVALGQIGPAAKAAVSKIVQALAGDKIEGVRFAAAYALGQIGVKDERAISSLKEAMKSDQPFLQVIAAWAVVRLDRDDQATVAEATKRILAGLEADDVNARRAAARALAEINPPPEVVAPVLVKAIHDADPTVIANAVDALASLGPKIVPRLAGALKNKDLRLHAARVLARIGPDAKEAAPALTAALDDAEGEYRREVQFALGALGPAAAPAVPALIVSLESEDDHVRNSAVYALGKIGPAAKTSTPALTKLLSSEDDFVRFSALWALVRIEPGDKRLAAAAVPAMVVLLADSRELVRAEAATTLGELGPAAKAALPDLKNASADADPTVSAAAKQSIERISGK